MSTDPQHQQHPSPSPGNAFAIHADTPPMRLPFLEFIYRLECDVAPTDVEVGDPHGAGIVRSIAPIVGGKVRGPNIEADVLSVGAADWATVVKGTHSMKLEARYLLRTTNDAGHHILVDSRGLYRPGPGTEYAQRQYTDHGPPPPAVTQDDVEFFTHVTFEAGAQGPYNWLNGLVCVGVLQCVQQTRIVLDCYRLTNFPGREAESVVVR